ncbi:type IX secretion/gliding motility protein PorT/SprT [Dawidia soli]
MQISHIWNKFYIHRHKVGVVLCLLFLWGGAAAQTTMGKRARWAPRNNPNYDNRKLTYGFLIGIHSSAFKLKYSDPFVSQQFDSVHSVIGAWSGGFSLGFIVNYRLDDQVDVRLTPKVGFYENKVSYLYTDKTPREDLLLESTMVEFPLLLKYKSQRRGNIRMYMIGGVTPAIEASGKKNGKNGESLEITGSNLSLEGGFGFDLYYPLFKFSPEIRFSHGLFNILDNKNNIYGQPLKSITTNTVTVYFLFQ